MKPDPWKGLCAALLLTGAALPAVAKAPRAYILNGYSFGGFPGVNTDELAAKLKDQEGARVTEKDIAVDEAMLTHELSARRIQGQLFTTIAEKHGRVWVIFDLQKSNPASVSPGAQARRLESQHFEGDVAVSASALAAATGLKPGDPLPTDRINAARGAIVTAYEKVLPGKPPSIKGKMRIRPDGEVVLTWIISEQK